MSEVRLRTPLLPPVYVFRYLEPLRMHPAHPRADRAQGRTQSMYVLFHARPGRKGNLHAKFSPSHGCPHSIRESLQKVSWHIFKRTLHSTQNIQNKAAGTLVQGRPAV